MLNATSGGVMSNDTPEVIKLKDAFLPFALFLLVVLEMYLSRPVRHALVASHWGSKVVPYLSLVGLVLSLTIARLQSGIFQRRGAQYLFAILAAGMAAYYLSYIALSSRAPAAFTLGLSIARTLYGLFAIATIWGLVSSLYSYDEARRLFAYIGAGGPLGAVVGAYTGEWLIRLSGHLTTLFVSGCLVATTGVLSLIASARIQSSPNLSRAFLVHEGADEADLSLVGPQLFSRFRYTRLLAVLFALAACTASVLDWGLFRIAEISSHGLTDRASFFAAAYRNTALVSLGAQVLFTPFCFKILGPSRSLMIVPLLAVVAGVLGAGFAGATVMLGTIVVLRGLDYSVNQCSREILFVPTPDAVRFKAKGYVDATGRSLGTVVGALLVMGLSHLSNTNVFSIATAVVTLGIFWAWAAWTMGQEHKALLTSLGAVECTAKTQVSNTHGS